MSDTDDTDDLLLIPPDFFIIESDSSHSNFEPFCNIVDNLIQKVSNLQERIHSIESSSLNTSLDYCFDRSNNMQKPSGFRKYSSSDDLYIPQSTQSTPQKPHTKFKLNSLPASPNIDKFSPLRNGKFTRELKAPMKTSSPKRRPSPEPYLIKNDQILNEVDTFLSKVKTIQRINAVRNIEREFGDVGLPKPEASVADYNLPEREIEAEVNNDAQVIKEKTWRQGDNKESVPDYGAGIRETLYKRNKLPGNYKKQTTFDLSNDSWTSMDKYPLTDSSSESTQITAYDKYIKERSDLMSPHLHTNALNVLNMHKQLLESETKGNYKSKTKEPKPRSANTLNDNLGLLSLADIWNKNSNYTNHNPSQMLQKFQEEKLRRQHCEDLIQELQNRNLELQQKLTVAVKVDESKNNTIHQFQEALEKIVVRLEKLNKDKQNWDKEMSSLKNKHAREMEEKIQKMNYYETEASKALNLAHGNQEKLSDLEKRCVDLQGELQSIEKKCKEIEDDYSRELEKNKQLSEILSQKEIELNENKNILNAARTEVAQSKKAVEVCQEEFIEIKSECNRLKDELQVEKEQMSKLREEKLFLMSQLEEHKKHEGELKEDVEKMKKQLDNNKLELRNYYQGQVEILVQNKLKEFQTQLDQAEQAFKDEIKKREMSIAKAAAAHMQQVSEKYSLEIQLLEKKHQEETKLYQVQIMQYKQQIDDLQSKMGQLHDKRVVIAKQLQKIMESQWAEALRIITNGKSPTFDENTFSTIDQLNSLKTKSYNNVEEVLAQQTEDNEGRLKPKGTAQFLSLQNNEIFGIRYEKKLGDSPVDTPVSSRIQGSKMPNENEIQKYINLLLNRPPGNPVQDCQQKGQDNVPENVTDRAAWQHVRSRKHK